MNVSFWGSAHKHTAEELGVCRNTKAPCLWSQYDILLHHYSLTNLIHNKDKRKQKASGEQGEIPKGHVKNNIRNAVMETLACHTNSSACTGNHFLLPFNSSGNFPVCIRSTAKYAFHRFSWCFHHWRISEVTETRDMTVAERRNQQISKKNMALWCIQDAELRDQIYRSALLIITQHSGDC